MSEQDHLDELKGNLRDVFEGFHGQAESWKATSDRLYSPEDAINTWGALRARHLIPSVDESLVFVSPSANIPTHELAIWKQEDMYRNGRLEFVVGDIARINPADIVQQTQLPRLPQHHFMYVTLDAQNLPVGNNSVNVLWDRKGWLYYVASSRLYGKVNNPQAQLLQAFERYSMYLKPQGIIVVDAMEPGDTPRDTEPSTVGAAELYFGNTFFEHPLFKTTFRMVDIGSGVAKMRVFVKQ